MHKPAMSVPSCAPGPWTWVLATWLLVTGSLLTGSAAGAVRSISDVPWSTTWTTPRGAAAAGPHARVVTGEAVHPEQSSDQDQHQPQPMPSRCARPTERAAIGHSGPSGRAGGRLRRLWRQAPRALAQDEREATGRARSATWHPVIELADRSRT